jgi:hypothetical protein
VGQERLGPSYFFISLVLGPLNSLLWYVPSSVKVYMELCSYFLFLQEQIKDIIITTCAQTFLPQVQGSEKVSKTIHSDLFKSSNIPNNFFSLVGIRLR